MLKSFTQVLFIAFFLAAACAHYTFNFIVRQCRSAFCRDVCSKTVLAFEYAQLLLSFGVQVGKPLSPQQLFASQLFDRCRRSDYCAACVALFWLNPCVFAV